MNAKVKVVLLASFREIAGEKEVVKEIKAGLTLGHVLDELAKRYGRDFEQVVDRKAGTVSPEFLVSINGRIVRDVDVKLNDGDVIILTVPASGG